MPDTLTDAPLEQAQAVPKMDVISFGPTQVEEARIANVVELAAWRGKNSITWVNIDSVENDHVIAEIGAMFNLHALALEDVANPQQRAKVEQYGEHYYVVARMVSLAQRVETEQLSMFFGKDFVLTFQGGRNGDPFNRIRERIRKGGGRIREHGADHLAYCLLDAVIDGYFPVLEEIGERLERIEETILNRRNSAQTPAHVHEIKRDILAVRRSIWPIRDAVNLLNHDVSELVAPDTRLYLRDCTDHSMRIMDMVEMYREVCADLTNLHLTSVSTRMNEIMKVLAVITVLFAPPTLIAGIYGMNFKDVSPWNMPELSWTFGYPFALLLMGGVMLGIFWWLKLRGWLSKP